MNTVKISNKISYIVLALIILVSLAVSTFYMNSKQGYHEDELLTYNLANSSKKLDTSGTWSTPEDFNQYLSVGKNDRFNFHQVYQNQVEDASHPPLYYALVHTVCSLFPESFSKWYAYAINLFAVGGALVLLFSIAKRVSRNNFYALTGTAAYALSIACVTTTIYLRMYALLTFFVLAFVRMTLKFYDSNNKPSFKSCALSAVIVTLGTLTQYYFILFALLVGIVFILLKIKMKHINDVSVYIGSFLLGAAVALCVYPHIIGNVLGGNRGVTSLSFSIDLITAVTYLIYKLCTYVQIMAKDLFLDQVWLLALCFAGVLGFWIYFRFVKKQRLSGETKLIVIPSFAFFAIIALVSPFNSDRYVMCSYPLISLVFAFALIRILSLIHFKNSGFIAPACVLLSSVLALASVTPNYVYGRTNLYDKKTDYCVFVGTAMLEYNKCVDKLMQYDGALIVQTDEMSKTLGSELDEFANKRGVITNGKIDSLIGAYMNNGDVERKSDSSIQSLKTDKKLNSLDEVTVYISRLADKESVIDYITENTDFKNCELVCADYEFEEFYNWYDYFMQTESYCNVYRFYKS